jgi:hypothetical protein
MTYIHSTGSEEERFTYTGTDARYNREGRPRKGEILPGRDEVLTHRVQTGSGAHIASYPMGAKRSFPGSKAAGA